MGLLAAKNVDNSMIFLLIAFDKVKNILTIFSFLFSFSIFSAKQALAFG